DVVVVTPPPAMPLRRFRTPHTGFPHAQFLSNGNYVTIVTNAGGGSSFCRGRAVTKSRRDPTRDPGSQFVYLRDVRTGSVWSATYHPTAAEPADYLVEFRAAKATLRRHGPERGPIPGSISAPPRRRPAATTTRSPRSSTSRSPPKTMSKSAG